MEYTRKRTLALCEESLGLVTPLAFALPPCHSLSFCLPYFLPSFLPSFSPSSSYLTHSPALSRCFTLGCGLCAAQYRCREPFPRYRDKSHRNTRRNCLAAWWIRFRSSRDALPGSLVLVRWTSTSFNSFELRGKMLDHLLRFMHLLRVYIRNFFRDFFAYFIPSPLWQ